MATKLEIWNMALGDAGQPLLTSTTAVNPTQQYLALIWPTLFKSQLELYDWAFARQTVVLVEEGTPLIDDQWNYEYTWPDDAVAIRAILPQYAHESHAFETRLRSHATLAQTIFTDLGDAYAVYTRLLDDTDDAEMAFLDAAFVGSIVYLLQSKLVMRVAQDDKKRDAALKLYQYAHSAAAHATTSRRVRRQDSPGAENLPPQIAGRR